MSTKLQNPWRSVRWLVGSDSRDLWTLLVYASVVGLLTLAIPIAVQALVGTVAFGALLQPIVVLALLLLAGLTLSATLRGLEVWVLERMTQRLFVRISLNIVRILTQSRSGALASQGRSDLVNRFFDVFSAQKALVKLLSDGLAVSLQTVIGLVALSLYHPWLLGFGLLFALALVGIVAGFGRTGVEKSLRESSAKYELAAWLEQIAVQPAIFRGVGRSFGQDVAEGRVRAWLAARKARFAVVFRQIVGTLALQVVSSVGLLVLGGALVINEQLTLGQLIAAELIVTAVASGVGKLGRSMEAAYDLTAAAAKLHSFESEFPQEMTGAAAPAPSPGGATVRLKEVQLALKGRFVVANANLTVSAGERIAIVGRSGSGKSALLDLLHGDWDGDPPAGIIEIDGLDIRSWDRLALRQRGTIVRQNSMFAGTLSENLSLSRPSSDVVQQQQILEQLGLWDVVGRDVAGLSQRLRGDGAPLPSGMCLPIALGRALLGRPRLVLVDGVGDLDPQLRRWVFQVLLDKSVEMTVIVAMANPIDLASFDRVMRLDDGQLRAVDVSQEAA